MRFDDYDDYVEESGKNLDSINQHAPRYLDNGEVYTLKYSDSVFKLYGYQKYSTLAYRDTLSNTFSFVLHKLTEAEMKENDDYWTKTFKDDEENRKKLKGTIIDDLTLTDISGVTHTMQSLQGKIIIIDFWFIKCYACVQEMPELNKLKQQFGTENVAYFGVTFDKKDKVKKFLEHTKFNFTIVPDGKKLTERFGIKFYPTTLILDQERQVVYTGDSGALNDRKKEIKKIVRKLSKNRKSMVIAGPFPDNN
ncbi:hypothetical protein Q765_03740 [Flavobacterium rivuli WB 3.3-2 = DSM 21788]|uniref:Thioredoxin domain-containing protein n=2 Tax=Flavobacterium rivuli TaxID=498301 RepID=A0A0A2M986_9FLAO|nr:hypothetical protein Q765_03740 [Flavobacterium rivuli WB 3.3-2 = DSM 21788]